MFIQTEATPNPATLKFLPGKVVLEEGTAEFRDTADAAERSPLASALMAVPNVTGVFFGYDFITVTREGAEWQHLKPAILAVIMEHFMSDRPVMAHRHGGVHVPDDGDEFFEESQAGTVATIKELLETRVRPAVAQDGGDITFRGFRDGTVYLNMRGSCAGCPSSTATLKQGIQNLLRHFVPEVETVEAVEAA
ncbi:NifU family protein [Aurantimonas sp. Leaf443]|uniref:NifU family protein n=1 Tax=Aurantimonas sp. Leaf443 TaxID=1736378 RepID=UPI0006FE25DD|nr:NifU family protein [Aurantimonas sp. Leaf443]KQT83941.1 iron transporter [Aurantimonas sp. Leaf443]